MIDYREQQKKKGINYGSLAEVAEAAGPVWKVTTFLNCCQQISCNIVHSQLACEHSNIIIFYWIYLKKLLQSVPKTFYVILGDKFTRNT